MSRFTQCPDWFVSEDVGENIVRIIEPCYREDYRCNMYLVRGRDRDILIDTGLGLASLRPYLKPISDDPLLICSHAHYDHIGSAWEFSRRLIHAAEADILAAPTRENTYANPILETKDFLELPWPHFDAGKWEPTPAPATGLIGEGDVVDLGDRRFQVLSTPGHSWGSVCLWDSENGVMLCADTVYEGELFDFLPCSDVEAYKASMARLCEMPVRVAFPGHGPILSGEKFREIARKYLEEH